MRAKGSLFQQVLLGLILLLALAWNLAQAAEIRSVSLSSGATGTRAELQLDRASEFNVISLANPHRLVIDLPQSRLAAGVRLPAGAGLVRGVRNGEPVPGTARIVFDLSDAVVALTPRIEQGADGPRLVVEWPGDGPSPSVASAPAAANVAPTAAAAASGPAHGAARPVAASVAGNPTTGVSPAPSSSAPSAVAATPPAVTPVATAPAGGSVAAVVQQAASTSNPRAILEARPQPAASQPHAAAATPAAAAPTAAARVAPTPAPAPVTAAAVVAEPAAQPAVRLRNTGMRPLVVAIDAGHGGQDPGAVGPTGLREKDVALRIARELARQVDATPGLQAYLVRNADEFVPLGQRAQRARRAKADIFLSIHADAAENRSARGGSVYVLSLRGASSQRARWLADKENAADLIGGRGPISSDDTLNSVLLDLTQSGNMKASEDAARHVLDSMSGVGSIRRVERANFAVLRTAHMPAMLVETAFISNPEEERKLADPGFQRRMAGAILQGIHSFFSSQPPPGTMYAARAEAGGAAGASGSGGSR